MEPTPVRTFHAIGQCGGVVINKNEGDTSLVTGADLCETDITTDVMILQAMHQLLAPIFGISIPIFLKLVDVDKPQR